MERGTETIAAKTPGGCAPVDCSSVIATTRNAEAQGAIVRHCCADEG